MSIKCLHHCHESSVIYSLQLYHAALVRYATVANHASFHADSVLAYFVTAVTYRHKLFTTLPWVLCYIQFTAISYSSSNISPCSPSFMFQYRFCASFFATAVTYGHKMLTPLPWVLWNIQFTAVSYSSSEISHCGPSFIFQCIFRGSFFATAVTYGHKMFTPLPRVLCCKQFTSIIYSCS
jgi:hypothetical protein